MPETSPPRSHLRVDRRADGVVVLTLDNPTRRNAMSEEMTASWVAAVDEVAADRSVRAVVVTGAGTAFCSGGDTGWIASEPDAAVDHLRTRMIGFPTRYTTLALRNGASADFESAVQWEALAQPVTLATADLHEGVAAAREKRAPGFTGR